MLLNQVCYRTKHLPAAHKLSTYVSIGGYQVWREIIATTPPIAGLIESVRAAKLQGRGGAAFPAWQKLQCVAENNAPQKYVICNADEGEPGTFKDRDILRYNPHQIIEGIAIASYAVAATVAYVYIRGDYSTEIAIMEAALREAKAAGFLGENLNDKGLSLQIHCFYGAGAYICGEETALLESMAGRRGQPTAKPPFPTSCGLYGCPTLIHNTETLASIPVILAQGPAWYLALGVNGASGCKIFSVSGQVKQPGNYELPLGIAFAELLAIAGGMLNEQPLKAVMPGGISSPILPANIIMRTVMAYTPLQQLGSELGTGAVIIMNNSTKMPEILLRCLEFYQDESCGKCTPCREGIGWVLKIATRLANRQGRPDDLIMLQQVVAKIGTNSLCALGDAVPKVVAGFLTHFAPEFMANIMVNN